jgi:tryptophanyl-tRNA synthetase
VRKAAAGVDGWTEGDTELLLGYMKGAGKTILTEPQALHTEVLRLPGLDGAKMSKSYGNAVLMRDEPAVVEKKIRGMTTDPARARRTDPGDPEKCPVWQFHKIYSDEPTRDWVVAGCKSAGIGCLECKAPVIDAVVREQQPWRERAESYLANPKQVHWIVEMGTERARTVAKQTMRDVREAMGLNY